MRKPPSKENVASLILMGPGIYSVDLYPSDAGDLLVTSDHEVFWWDSDSHNYRNYKTGEKCFDWRRRRSWQFTK